jgi:hypothetical protein
LSEGAIIVTAAKKAAGHLYVETKDAIVSVTGTVFLVSVEPAGSRAGVIEGVVNVRYGAISQNLLPVQQLATNPAMEQIPLDVQVSWSRNAALYLALLKRPVVPVQPPAVVVTTAPPQSRPAAAPQSAPEAAPCSLLARRTMEQVSEVLAITGWARRMIRDGLPRHRKPNGRWSKR